MADNAQAGRSRSTLMTAIIAGLIILAIVVALFALTANRGRAQRADDGAFHGEVTRVRSDRLTLRTDSGTIRVDTWGVCGDRTNVHLSTGDQIQVYASRDFFSYDAWRILNADGTPACVD